MIMPQACWLCTTSQYQNSNYVLNVENNLLFTFFAILISMKPTVLKILQFTASLLVLMEGIRRLDSSFNFPWFHLITGVVMLSIIALIPALNSKYYLTGAVIYFAEGIVVGITGLQYYGDFRKYGALLYIVVSLLLIAAGFRNIRKS